MSERKPEKEQEQKEVWYYRQVPYKTGKNKGKLHYEYNWPVLGKEVIKAIVWFEKRGIKPTIIPSHSMRTSPRS